MQLAGYSCGLVSCLSLVLYVALLLPGYSWPTALDKEAFHIMSSNTPSLRSNRLAPTCYLYVLLLFYYSFWPGCLKSYLSTPLISHHISFPFSFFFPFSFSLSLAITAANFVVDSRVFSKQWTFSGLEFTCSIFFPHSSWQFTIQIFAYTEHQSSRVYFYSLNKLPNLKHTVTT